MTFPPREKMHRCREKLLGGLKIAMKAKEL
jgi:hypothetical protein